MAKNEKRMETYIPPHRYFVACEQCGARFESGVSYPVVTRVDAEGSRQIHSFCDESCKDAWEAEH